MRHTISSVVTKLVLDSVSERAGRRRCIGASLSIPLILMGPYVFRESEQANQPIFSSEMKMQARVRHPFAVGSRGGERNQPVAMGSSVVLKEGKGLCSFL